MPDDPTEQMAERVAQSEPVTLLLNGYLPGLCGCGEVDARHLVDQTIAAVLSALSPQDAAELAVARGGMVSEAYDDGGAHWQHTCGYATFFSDEPWSFCPACEDTPTAYDPWTPLYRKADGRRDT